MQTNNSRFSYRLVRLETTDARYSIGDRRLWQLPKYVKQFSTTTYVHNFVSFPFAKPPQFHRI